MFREHWHGPLLIKGIMRPDDAVRAVEHGVEGIIVSNHGGRQLDHAQSTIEALPAIADAVAGRAELYLDSGIRRGTDIITALALGARAVLIGRPMVYGLGAAGEAGARRAFELLRGELATALALAGYPRISELGPDAINVQREVAVLGLPVRHPVGTVGVLSLGRLERTLGCSGVVRERRRVVVRRGRLGSFGSHHDTNLERLDRRIPSARPMTPRAGGDSSATPPRPAVGLGSWSVRANC